MEQRIELAAPELVAMQPEEHQEAVGLLAALLGDARSPMRARSARRRGGRQGGVATGLPMAGAITGNSCARKAPGGSG